jgi:RNA polymerase sigma factor (sigma-70 family)
MARDGHDPMQGGSGGGHFVTTRWSLVLAAGGTTSAESRAALETLCGLYWYPLYAYIRRRGYSPEQAEDLTQGFFARLLASSALEAADPRRGRFRSFLLTSAKHFLADERDKGRARKRGGGRKVISLDVQHAEGRYRLDPADDLTAEKLFERHWARTLLELVLADLRRQYARAGKESIFEQLKGSLRGKTARGSYGRAGDELGMTEAAARVAVHRLRRRYRTLLREHIAQTVSSPEDVDDEIRHLFAVFEA